MHKSMLLTIIALLVVAALITLIQIWAPFLSWDIYGKIIISALIIGGVLGLIMALKSDLSEHKNMKDENYLD